VSPRIRAIALTLLLTLLLTGAAFGTATAIVLGASVLGGAGIAVFAFLGALLATLLVYAVSFPLRD
jgi:ABC-type Fe3+-siderophore transport system permease subunit